MLKNLPRKMMLIGAVAALAAVGTADSARAASYGQLVSFGSAGTGDGQFTRPLLVGNAPPTPGAASGQIFVIDFNPNGTGFTENIRVEEFDRAGAFRRVVASETGNAVTGLLSNAVGGVAVDPGRNALYLSRPAKVATAHDMIEKYALDTGAKQANFVNDTGSLDSPGSIAVDPVNGDVFVAGESGPDADPKIQKYSSGGQPVGPKFGTTGPPDGGAAPNQFDSSGIDGLAVRHAGAGSKLYVLDFRTGNPDDEADVDAPRVTRYTNVGSTFTYDSGSELRSRNDTATDIAFTQDAIAVDAGGNLYLDLDGTEETPDAVGVIRITESGHEVFRFGGSGTGECQFWGPPRGLATEAGGGLEAIDANNAPGGVRRIVRFGAGGTGCGITSTNQPPQAAFTYSPGSPRVGQSVSFDATGTTDPDGTVDKYEWDLDGDGSFETDTGTDPHATKTFDQAGTTAVGLRVTDNEGEADTIAMDVTVTAGPASAKVTKDAKNVITFEAGAEQDNSVSIVKTNKVIIRDAGAAVDTQAPCLQGASNHEVICPSRTKAIVVKTLDGSDRIKVSSSSSDTIDAGDGNDTIDAGSKKQGHDTYIGGHGVDTIDFSARGRKLTIDQTLPGKDGQGGENSDVRPDLENIVGGPNDDTITGGSAPNRIDGGPGRDTLNGGVGDDVLDGGADGDSLNGGSDTDRVTYGDRTERIVADPDGMARDDGEGNEGDSIAADVENITGGSGSDVLIGNGLDNTLAGNGGFDMLDGGGGNDILQGGPGDDRMMGDDGADVADYADHTTGVMADLDGKLGDDGSKSLKEHDVIYDDIEGLTGGSGDDQLTGDRYANRLSGGDGKDRLNGNGGRDALIGGLGIDNLNGGRDNDFLDALDGAKDRINCGGGVDTLRADADEKKPKSCETKL